MSRFIFAVDVQPHFKPSPALVDQITRAGDQIPLVASIFVGDEQKVSFSKLGKTPGPAEENCLVPTNNVFPHHGYLPPKELIDFLVGQQAEEVVVVGGFHDERLLAAGAALFDASIKPSLLPMLCYGNQWYEHTVTMNLWENALGPVYQSPIELGIAI